MCGIGGIIDGARFQTLRDRCESMQSALRHRGPDDQGIFIDPSASLGLVHTRLAILDLSADGHQPMQSPDGRWTVVFNGEIYNFQELRAELAASGVPFRSHSDTEVVLHLYAQRGPAMLERLAGMFALAIWDSHERKLFMARDPLGIKQLYYWQVGNRFAFASELRALLQADLAQPKMDRDALARYLLMGSVQEPDSLVCGVNQLPAGCCLNWQAGASSLSTYWTLEYQNSMSQSEAACTQLRAALDQSIRRHFVSDVPVGIFLSGGIDSSAVVALARANGFQQLKTFCLSFGEQAFNEGDVASRTAQHYGTEHHDWRMTATDGLELLDGFLNSLDLPSNDGFNTYCVSRFAHDQGLKVVLSGLGGDELYGGYPSFSRVPSLMNWYRWAKLGGKLPGLLLSLCSGSRPTSQTPGRLPAIRWRTLCGLLDHTSILHPRGGLPHRP